jgi:hypothetical protein
MAPSLGEANASPESDLSFHHEDVIVGKCGDEIRTRHCLR